MKINVILHFVIRFVSMLSLAGILAAEESSTTNDATLPRWIPLDPKAPVAIRYAVGVQNMTVPDVDSNTFGVNASASFDGTLKSGIHAVLEGDFFLDFDHDHLDPHHTPIWWQLHAGLSGPLMQSSPPGSWNISWVADVDTRQNTVSSIERDLKAIPSIVAGAKFGILSIDAKLGAGFYALTIDDDVPRERGYDRDDLRNRTWAISPALEARLELTRDFKLIGRAQEWHDGSVWLETKYYAALDWDLTRFIPHADLMFSLEATQYNLSPYHPTDPAPNYLPILPWDDDRLFKLSVNIWW